MPTLVDSLKVARLNTAAAAPKSRFNRLSLAVVFVFACMSQNAFSLGLGEIEVSSVINEPLAASIPVLNADGIEQAELIVALGSATDYQIAGVTWDFSHSELQFDVSYAANGDLMVNVSSSRAIREPYLNLLVQARWPAGRLLREYTILLDFPVFTGDQNSSSAVSSAPVARASAPTPAPIAAAPAPRPAPVVAQPNPAPRLVSVAPAADSAVAVQPLGEDDYRIQNGDTLWSLGGRVAQDLGVSRHQAMLAIQESNPEAFTQGNLNMMRSGSVIRVPTRNAALSRSATQAASEFAQAMSVSGQIASATPLQSRATDFRNEAGSDQAGDAQFRLTSADQANAAVAGSGVDQIIEENQLLSDINAALEEELQAASIENRDLSDRLQNLEEQNAVMEALIEVDNSEARAVQEAVTTQPVVNTITTAEVQEEGLVSKLLGVLPIVGLVVIGLLAGAYLVIRRRKSGDHAGDIAGFDEEYDEDAPIYAEQPGSEESVETAEPEQEPQAEPEEPAGDDLENFTADVPDDSAQDLEIPVDAPDEEQLSTDTDDQEEVTAEPEASAPAEEEEDWASDFDDLDAFFDDVDETASPAPESEVEADISEAPEEAVEEAIEEPEEENESEKTQIFDASMLAGASLDRSEEESEPEEENAESAQEVDADAEESDEQLVDFSLDEDDLTTDEPEQEASQDQENDEFALDFDMDGDDSEVESPESEAEPEAESDEVDPKDDENMLAFDVSDEDLPSESEESEQSEEIEEIEAAEPVPESEPEPEPEPESEDNSDSDELDLSDLGFDDEESEASNDDLDALLDQADEETDDDTTDSEDAEVADTTDADDNAATDEDEDLNIDLDGDLDDLSALLDEVEDENENESSTDSEEEPSADQEPSAEEEPSADEEPSANKEPSAEESADDTDDLLGDFGDDDLDLSDVGDGGDVAEECETKLELAAAYIEMGDNSGAKELLDEVVREGDESFQARANEMIEKMG